MRVATYTQGKGKNRARYRCEVKPDGLVFRLLGRAGVFFCGRITRLRSGFLVVGVDRLGQCVAADFSDLSLAKSFLYRVSRSVSPQLSLFGWMP